MMMTKYFAGIGKRNAIRMGRSGKYSANASRIPNNAPDAPTVTVL